MSEATIEQVLADAKASGPPKKLKWLEELLAPYTAEGSGSGLPECAICMDEMLTPTLTCCELPHAFCLECVLECMKENTYGERKCRCPLCRTMVTQRDLVTLKLTPPAADVAMAVDDAGGAAASGGAVGGAEGDDDDDDGAALRSTKLDALVAALRQKTDEHPKTLIFTQFAATQRLVCERLASEGLAAVSIASGASQAQRAKALQAFTSDPEVGLFVLSLDLPRSALICPDCLCVPLIAPDCMHAGWPLRALDQVGLRRPHPHVRLAGCAARARRLPPNASDCLRTPLAASDRR